MILSRSDRHVAFAVKDPHGRCIECHDRPRFRIGCASTHGTRAVCAGRGGSRDSGRSRSLPAMSRGHRECDREDQAADHRDPKGDPGGGRSSDCHAGVGHRKGTSTVGGMSRCTACHDGVVAKRTCETCHIGGSPITLPGEVMRATSAFDYAPTVRVANRDCSKCHGAQKTCRDCHNGLVSHIRRRSSTAVTPRCRPFGGKQKCFKCHTMVWCGSGECHNGSRRTTLRRGQRVTRAARARPAELPHRVGRQGGLV